MSNQQLTFLSWQQQSGAPRANSVNARFDRGENVLNFINWTCNF